MFTHHDGTTILLALRDLLIEFPPSTDPTAVSALHQARMILKKYETRLANADHSDPG